MDSLEQIRQSMRMLLLPAALLYGIGVRLRNLAYDRGWLKTHSFNLPLISVGNLSVGGTGKSPMTEYIIALLKRSTRVAALSRGYGRRTKGYVLAGPDTTALEIGDEPMLLHRKHPDVPVAVGESRVEAMAQLLFDRPDTQAVVLDDAFQHRSVKPGLSILLTERENLYTRDLFLPTGDLRDQRSSARRADIVVVTKCPPGMDLAEAESIGTELSLDASQELFFTTIDYGTPHHLFTGAERRLDRDTEVLLFTGIANPAPLKAHLDEVAGGYDEIRFGDHHQYDIDDVASILGRYESLGTERRVILTTEKDAVRLGRFERELREKPVFAMPIRIRFLFDGESRFNRRMVNFIATYEQRPQRP